MVKVTPQDLLDNFNLLDTDPLRYLALTEARLRDNPDDLARGYFSRHQAWVGLGRNDLALDDLNKSIELDPDSTTFRVRGQLLHSMGRFQEAIADFDRSQALAPEEWEELPGLFFRADCHASLGNEQAALADCRALPETHWTPGPGGLPAGNKQEVIMEIRRRAAAAKQSKN